MYAIAGVLYFLYTIGKKAQEKEKEEAAKRKAAQGDSAPKQVTVSPPVAKPFDEVMREQKRQQAAKEARQKALEQKPKPLTTFQQKKEQPKDIFIKEKKKATFGQGVLDAPVYEDEVVENENNKRGDIRLVNEGIYKVQTMEEARAEADVTAGADYEFDAKQAFIGSVIFERKY